LLLTFSFSSTTAQQQTGQLVINAGVGYSPEFNGVFSATYPVGLNYNIEYFSCSSIVPNLNLALDYGLAARVSIGIAGSYQSETVNYDLGSLPFSDDITRINMAIRLLYHFNKTNKKFDHYIGIRGGYCYWQDDPVYNDQSDLLLFSSLPTFLKHPNWLVPSFQVLYGMRLYLGDSFGLHCEAGIGEPFLFEGGLTFRINTRKQKDTKSAEGTQSK